VSGASVRRGGTIQLYHPSSASGGQALTRRGGLGAPPILGGESLHYITTTIHVNIIIKHFTSTLQVQLSIFDKPLYIALAKLFQVLYAPTLSTP
jgi:hypothetical protein